jgi:single-stranded-DNA-specific exonuclease
VIGFDVYNAIENCANLLEQFGGHKYAAGLSLKKENLQSFIVQFEKEVCQSITNEQMNPEILIDRELNFDQINFKTYRIINQMEPFGPGNSRPIFMTKNILDTGYAKLIGKDQTHLKLSITNSDRRSNIDAIGFGMHSKKDLVINRQHFSICYNIDLNEWNGKTSIQLRLKDLK